MSYTSWRLSSLLQHISLFISTKSHYVCYITGAFYPSVWGYFLARLHTSFRWLPIFNSSNVLALFASNSPQLPCKTWHVIVYMSWFNSLLGLIKLVLVECSGRWCPRTWVGQCPTCFHLVFYSRPFGHLGALFNSLLQLCRADRRSRPSKRVYFLPKFY